MHLGAIKRSLLSLSLFSVMENFLAFFSSIYDVACRKNAMATLFFSHFSFSGSIVRRLVALQKNGSKEWFSTAGRYRRGTNWFSGALGRTFRWGSVTPRHWREEDKKCRIEKKDRRNGPFLLYSSVDLSLSLCFCLPYHLYHIYNIFPFNDVPRSFHSWLRVTAEAAFHSVVHHKDSVSTGITTNWETYRVETCSAKKTKKKRFFIVSLNSWKISASSRVYLLKLRDILKAKGESDTFFFQIVFPVVFQLESSHDFGVIGWERNRFWFRWLQFE